jgi:acetyl-CoA carboxylase carboxyl transferase subunit alpha
MREAAEALRLTAQDLAQLGVNNLIIDEPQGGAHRDPDASYTYVKDGISKLFEELSGKSPKDLINDRRKRFLDMGSSGLAA